MANEFAPFNLGEVMKNAESIKYLRSEGEQKSAAADAQRIKVLGSVGQTIKNRMLSSGLQPGTPEFDAKLQEVAQPFRRIVASIEPSVNPDGTSPVTWDQINTAADAVAAANKQQNHTVGVVRAIVNGVPKIYRYGSDFNAPPVDMFENIPGATPQPGNLGKNMFADDEGNVDVYPGAIGSTSSLEGARTGEKIVPIKLHNGREIYVRAKDVRDIFSNPSETPPLATNPPPQPPPAVGNSDDGMATATFPNLKSASEARNYFRSILGKDPNNKEAQAGMTATTKAIETLNARYNQQPPGAGAQPVAPTAPTTGGGLRAEDIGETTLAKENAKAAAQAAKEKDIAQFKANLPKEPSEYQQFRIDEAKQKKEADRDEALGNIDDTIEEFNRLKTLQGKTSTGPIIGSPPVAFLRKLGPNSLTGGENLQKLEKGFNTLAVRAIGAFRAGGVTFGQLSNAEGAWIRSTQATLDAGDEVNQDILNEGLRLLQKRKERILKLSRSEGGHGTETQVSTETVERHPRYDAATHKEKDAVDVIIKGGDPAKLELLRKGGWIK